MFDTCSEIYYQNARDYNLTMTTFTCMMVPAHMHQTFVKISCANCFRDRFIVTTIINVASQSYDLNPLAYHFWDVVLNLVCG